MKKKLFFCVIVCIGFVGVLSKPNVGKRGSLMMGNIEALSQNETGDTEDKVGETDNKDCSMTDPDGNTLEGVWYYCVESKDESCSPACFKK